jgi:hypothetical protein
MRLSYDNGKLWSRYLDVELSVVLLHRRLLGVRELACRVESQRDVVVIFRPGYVLLVGVP